MHHEPAVELAHDHASTKKAKLGVRFFFIYLIFYAGFVIIGVFNYEFLDREVFWGVNLAILYGAGLILFAVLLGVLYNRMCSSFEDHLNGREVSA